MKAGVEGQHPDLEMYRYMELLRARYYHTAGMTTQTHYLNALEVPRQACCQVIVLHDVGVPRSTP
jgi:hypothetical protein